VRETPICCGNGVCEDVENHDVCPADCICNETLSEADLSAIRGLADAFNVSRDTPTKYGPAEATCRQFTGIDRGECYDRETCMRTCSGTYLCSQAMYGTEGFLSSLEEYSKALTQMDANMKALYENLARLNASSNASELTAVYENFLKLHSAAIVLNASKLTRSDCAGCVEFCPRSALNLSALSEAMEKSRALRNCIS